MLAAIAARNDPAPAPVGAITSFVYFDNGPLEGPALLLRLVPGDHCDVVVNTRAHTQFARLGSARSEWLHFQIPPPPEMTERAEAAIDEVRFWTLASQRNDKVEDGWEVAVRVEWPGESHAVSWMNSDDANGGRLRALVDSELVPLVLRSVQEASIVGQPITWAEVSELARSAYDNPR